MIILMSQFLRRGGSGGGWSVELHDDDRPTRSPNQQPPAQWQSQSRSNQVTSKPLNAEYGGNIYSIMNLQIFAFTPPDLGLMGILGWSPASFREVIFSSSSTASKALPKLTLIV